MRLKPNESPVPKPHHPNDSRNVIIGDLCRSLAAQTSDESRVDLAWFMTAVWQQGESLKQTKMKLLWLNKALCDRFPQAYEAPAADWYLAEAELWLLKERGK